MKGGALLLRFGSVGGLASLVHAGTGAAGLAAGLPPGWANLLGFALAFAVGFVGHHRVTFAHRQAAAGPAAMRYAAVSVSSFLCGQCLLWVLTVQLAVPGLAALAAAILMAAAVNFLFSSLWAFAARD